MGEMTLFQNGAALPSYLRTEALTETTKSLMGFSSKRISIEGGIFRMLVGGQEVAVNEDRAMNMIIVRAADHNSRTFYEGTYVRGTKVKPTCWSDDGVTPHSDIKNPQSKSCATCPQNIKGSGQRENSRACRFQRRLAVVLENDIQGDIYAVSIPAASIFGQGEGRKMGLQQYARLLGGHGTDVTAVVTEFRFDTQAEGVKLIFSPVRPLEQSEWDIVRARRDDPAAVDAVTMTVGQLDGATEESAAPQEAPAPAPAPVKAAAPAPAPVVAKPQAKSGFVVTKKEEAPAQPAAKAEEIPEPTVRETAKPVATNVSAILSDWGGDADD